MKFFAGNRIIVDPKTPVTQIAITELEPLAVSLGEAPRLLPHTMLNDRAVISINQGTRAYPDEIVAPFFDRIEYFSRVSGIARTVPFLKQCYSQYSSMIILCNTGVVGYIGLYPLHGTNLFVLEFIINPAAEINEQAFEFLPGFIKQNIPSVHSIVTIGYNSDTKRFAASINASILKDPSPELIDALKGYYPDINKVPIYLHSL